MVMTVNAHKLAATPRSVSAQNPQNDRETHQTEHELEEHARVERDHFLALGGGASLGGQLLFRGPFRVVIPREVVHPMIAIHAHQRPGISPTRHTICCARSRRQYSRSIFAQEIHLRVASGESLDDGSLQLEGRGGKDVDDDVGACERLVECLAQRAGVTVRERVQLGPFLLQILRLLGRRVAGQNADVGERGAEVREESLADMLTWGRCGSGSSCRCAVMGSHGSSDLPRPPVPPIMVTVYPVVAMVNAA